MADIAELGFSVDSSQLEKGVASLEKLSSASKSANTNAKLIGSSMTQAAKVFAGAVAGMNQGILALVSSSKSATAEQIAAAKQASDYANKIYNAASAENKLSVAVDNTTRSLEKRYKTMLKAASTESTLNRINRLTNLTSGKSAQDSYSAFRTGMTDQEWKVATGQVQSTSDKQVNRFNTANIAAQFQDIAVTAAMGMNPLTVALQQGTQLSAIINMMEKPLKGLAEAFKSIINPVSLLSIGLTALVVAGIQMVDWVGVGVSALEGLKSIFDWIADNSTTVASALMIVASGLAAVGVAMVALKWSSIVAGLTNFYDKLTAADSGLRKFGSNVLDFIKKLGKLSVAILTNPFVMIPVIVIAAVEAFSYFKDSVKTALTNTVDWAAEKINKLIGFFVGLKDVITNSISLIKKGISEGVGAAKDEAGSIMSEAMSKKYIGDETVEDIKGAVETAVDTAAAGIQKVNKAVGDAAGALGDKLKTGMKSVSGYLSEKIKGLTEDTKKAAKEAERLKKAWDDIVKTGNRDIESINLEKRLYTADPYTQTYEQTLYDLMNKAKDQGIDLQSMGESGITKQEELEKLAKRLTDAKFSLDLLSESTMTYKEKVDFAKSTTKGFFSDMKSGLQEGKSAWESFGDAVFNVLNKITDKMMDFGIDMLFAAGQAYFTGGTSAGVTSSGGSISSGWVSPDITAANGHSFSNGIVDSPTLFTFAKGGKFGVMGEAGPEAVMPLKRGPDGSLGVRAEGIGSGSNVVVNVINNSDSQARTEQRQTEQGTEIDVIIDKMVADKMSQPGTSSNSALRAFNNQQLVMR